MEDRKYKLKFYYLFARVRAHTQRKITYSSKETKETLVK